MIAKIHPTDQMTPRQRLLAAYKGLPVDRLPFWAKVTNNTWRTSQPPDVRELDNLQLLDYIHADGIFGAAAGVRIVRPRVSEEHTRSGNVQTTVIHTPDGDLVDRKTLDPYTQSWHPTEFPIKTAADLGRMRWFYTDVRCELDEQANQRGADACRKIGERGITHSWCGTSPLMNLVEHLIGPVNTTYFLADFPAEMDELINQMHQAQLTMVRQIARHSPADMLISGENTSTTLISPQQFDKYCYVHLCEYGRIIESAGKMHELHMCGLLNALLERIDTIPASSIEAFTSPSLGDTRLVDGRTKAPSKTLVGGTNVNVWLKPLEQIKQYILQELAACPDNRRIVLTTAGVAPPGCSADTFRAVGKWIPTVPIRN